MKGSGYAYANTTVTSAPSMLSSVHVSKLIILPFPVYRLGKAYGRL